jgi:hypothetical protein
VIEVSRIEESSLLKLMVEIGGMGSTIGKIGLCRQVPPKIPELKPLE